jgi:hypothetical protein
VPVGNHIDINEEKPTGAHSFNYHPQPLNHTTDLPDSGSTLREIKSGRDK